MAKAIFNVFFTIIKDLTNIVLAPINILVTQLFPDIAILISTFNAGVERVLGASLGFFSSILPPITRTLIVLYLTVLIGFYTVSWTAHAVLKVYAIIKKIKVW